MRDILYLAIILGFFALGAAYIRACAAIVGHDPVVDAEVVRPVGARPRGRRGDPVSADHVIGLILAVVLFGYLIFALLMPEKF